MSNDYGEIKTLKRIYPGTIKKIAKRGTVKILVSQCKVSEKTIKAAEEKNIKVFDEVSKEKVTEINEKLDREKRSKENKEGE